MYETRSRFDNRYITKEFRELDLKRLREGRETTTSFRIVASEKIYLNRSAVFMTIATFKLLIHIVADYSLYWVLMTIRYHGSLQTSLRHSLYLRNVPFAAGLPTTGAHITGSGFVSRLLQSLLNTLNIPLLSSTPTSNSCLPNPNPPDFKRYSQIGTLIVLLWFFALLEPYGLRLRHLIMGHYIPERAKTRAAFQWLRYLLGIQFEEACCLLCSAVEDSHDENSYLSRFQWIRYLLGIQFEEACCLLCSAVEDSHDENSYLSRCEVPQCPGAYCNSCFSDIGQMCMICLSPCDYGDLSDVSLEKGSTDEDYDSDHKNDDNDPNNKYTVNDENENFDDNFNNENNISQTKHESDNESEYSGNEIDYEISPLLSHHIENASGIKTGYEKGGREILIEDTMIYLVREKVDLINMVLKNYLGLIDYDYLFFEFSEQIFTARNASDYLKNKYISYTCYGIYRISIHGLSLIVTKDRKTSKLAKVLRRKILRLKKKNNNKKLTFTSCYNDKADKTKKVRRADQNKDYTNQNNKDAPNKMTKKDKTKKPKNKEHKGDNKVSVSRKNSIPRIEILHAKCSKYWKNISNALSCTDVNDKKKELPTIEEKKHKRKKRHKKSKEHPKKHHKASYNNEDERQYRISTYLADADWRKNKINDKVIDEIYPKVQHTANFQKHEIEVNHDFAIGALERFFKRISKTCVIKSSSILPEVNSESSLPRSFKYFRSLNASNVR
ncbi:DC-STAMP domain-containing protein 2 [Operophtera brumata]|uniref:DC-STAMP domain-containing protein 2 n=1 Tax=Operophtera brumata TaxID=104452 RepID=A0A0L7LRB2_OPEBR|nr:DC-STAMP domain-containing protein 2 [Operophtera brumata]